MKRRFSVVLCLLAAVSLSGCTGPRPVRVVMESGDYLYGRGEYAAAAVEYEEVADRLPGDWRGQQKLGLCLLETGRYTEARRALEIAHANNPGSVEIIDALAEAMYWQGDEARLFAFLREQADLTQSVHAYLQLGHYSMMLNDPDSAKVAVDTAIELDEGQTVEPYLLGADLAERLQDDELQLRRLRQAYGIDPHNQIVKDRIRALGEVPGPTFALPPGR